MNYQIPVKILAVMALTTAACQQSNPYIADDTEGTDTGSETDGDSDTDSDTDTATDTGTEIEDYGPDSVAVGGAHTCAITATGGVECWGNNSQGQLGDGTTEMRDAPVGVEGFGTGVAAVAAGGYHTCILTSLGTVECWGDNKHGQLGDSTTEDSHAPVAVTDLDATVESIAANGDRTCAVTVDGEIMCWGCLRYSLDDCMEESPTPELVIGISGEVDEAAPGGYHACALDADGYVWCWGQNNNGQLGTGNDDDSTEPVQVVGLGGAAVAVSAGFEHTCALIDGGLIQCWGSTWSGQIGNGTDAFDNDELLPVDVIEPDAGAAEVSAGAQHTCAITGGGVAECWGGNEYGQLGDGTTAQRLTPQSVVGLDSEVEQIRAGSNHTCVRTVGGGVRCWGQRARGQLGDGKIADSATPVEAEGLESGVADVSAGSHHSCALTDAHQVMCWGNGQPFGLEDAPIPVEVDGLESVITAVVSGANHNCALGSSGGVACWGANTEGQLGDGTETFSPTPVGVVGLDSGIALIAAGGFHSCAVDDVGGVSCWGNNYAGQLGDGTETDSPIPVATIGLPAGVSQVSVGGSHTCAQIDGGAVWCWGANYSGELGDGTTIFSSVPVEVIGLDEPVESISCGTQFTCALTTTGAVECWGWNEHGQLGDGTWEDSALPVDVTGLGSGVGRVAASGWHACAIEGSGSLVCWGSNSSGALGDGTEEDRATPVEVVGLAEGVSAVAPGGNHVCAVTVDGGVNCWGYNYYGQLGNGLMAYCPTPVSPIGFED